MHRQRAAVRQPAAGRLRRGEVFHQGVYFGALVELGHNVASHQERLAVLLVYRREVENAIIFAKLRPFGEEGGDEVALFVQPTFRRVFKHGQRGVAKVGGDDGITAAKNVIVIEPDFTPGLNGVLHFGGTERQVAGHPGVVIFQRGGAQHYLFRPVGRRPAGGYARFDANAPGGVPVVSNGLRQGHQIVPRFGNLVSGRFKVVNGIPDQALAVETVPDTSHRAIHVSHVQPALVILLLQPIHGDITAGVYGFTLAHKVSHQPRLGEVGNVGGVAGVYAHRDGSFKLLAANVLHVNTGGLFKGGHRFFKAHHVSVGKGTVYGNDSAFKIAQDGLFQEAAGNDGEIHFRHRHCFWNWRFFWFRWGFFGRWLSGRFFTGFFDSFCNGLFRNGFRFSATTGRQRQSQDEQEAQYRKSFVG